ncbi:MAG: Ig-like domain-containing protein, partial [Tunicatimonas sp.]
MEFLPANGQGLQQATLSDSIVAENQAIGTSVGAFLPATASFSLAASAPGNAPFSIIDRQLVSTDSLNFEAVASYTLQVNVVFRSSLGEDSAATQAFVITVEEVNDPPVITNQLPLTTVENQPLTLALGNLSVSDEDTDDTYPEGFTLRAGAGDNYTVAGLTVTPTPNFSGTLTVPVVVNDGEADSKSYPLTVTVQALPRFSLAEEVYEVAEDFAEPEPVRVSPENPEQSVTYEISPGPEEVDFATLTADNSNGIYLFSALPDRNGEEEFTITATSDEQNTFAQEFTFRVNGVNDAPQFAGVQGNNQTVEAQAAPVSVPNFATNVAPGPPTATDESGQAVSFAITTSDNSLFAQLPTITPQGTLAYQPADDKIGTARVSVVLRDNGTDQGENVNTSAPQGFDVEVVAPLSPQNFDLNVSSVAENQPRGTVVGQFSESGRYLIDGGADANLFAINNATLFTQRPFNFENVDERTLEVRVERRFGFLNTQRESKDFVITVTNVEEPPTGITLSANTIPEGVAADTRVGFLTAQGGAPEVPVTFALVGGPGGENNGQFTIVGNELRISQVPDFETTPQYSVRVQATGDGVSPAQNFIIQVVNAEEPPTDILLSGTTVDENLPSGTAVGALSVEGGSAVPITYALSGPGAAAFTISGNQLLTQAPLNFEAQPNYALTITATGDGSFAKNFTIAVNNVVEAPTDIALSPATIEENQPVGTVVGTLSATGGEAVTTFELVSGDGSGDNGSFTIAGNQLLNAAVFDFETKASYSVRVRATGDGFFDKALTVDVINQLEPPTDITLSSTTVDENQPTGTVVGTVSAAGGIEAYTFALPEGRGNNGDFTLDGNELQTSREFDFENTPARTVVVVASNADGSYEEIIEVSIGNLPEPPTEITLSSEEIQENQPVGTTVGQLNATGGSGGDVSFALVSGPGSNDNDLFFIEDNELKANASFNFEFKEVYRVRARATGDGSLDQAFAINIINVEEPPTAILLSSSSVSENRNAGTEVGTLSTEGGEGNFT